MLTPTTMLKEAVRFTSTVRPIEPRRAWLSLGSGLLPLLILAGCQPLSNDPPELEYVCGTSPEAAFVSEGGTKVCGEGDANLPPEPTLPTDAEVCLTLKAKRRGPAGNDAMDESELDTDDIKAALNFCQTNPTKVVRLVAEGENNAFVTGPLVVNGLTLWIDKGVTVYASRNPSLYELQASKPGLCGKPGLNKSTACQEFINVTGANPRIVGDGAIDGQGDQPLIGQDYSWWELSQALRETNGSIGNPNLVVVKATGFVAYRISLYNSPKFHMKVGSSAAGGCDPTAPGFVNGAGFTVWGVTVLTPSRWFNSQGKRITPFDARNTDGIDPGTSPGANCGVIACSTISTSDDQIAIKGGNPVRHLVIAHNHFGTGHGISIGSETYNNVDDIDIYDLTIDNDSREVGDGSDLYDSNGIRIKSDLSRGGKVTNIRYRDICMRDQANTIMLVPSYNPLFSGIYSPEFSDITLENVRHVTCMNTIQPVVTFHGFNTAYPMKNVKLDNVFIDNIGPQGVSARYASFELGAGDVNFMPKGIGVTVTDNITDRGGPPSCSFPKLPTQQVPEGWLR